MATTETGNVYFNSGNINGLNQTILAGELRPNHVYTITLSDLEHLVSNGNESGISKKLPANKKTINSIVTKTFTTPADNVESDIDIVRNGDANVDVYIRSMSSPNYVGVSYKGIVRAYSDIGLAYSDVVASTASLSGPSVISLSVPNLHTTAHYFAAEFINTTHINLEVYTNQTKSVLQKNRVHDIRGLAYFRNDLYTNPVFEYLPEIQYLNQTNPVRYALSADGSIILLTINTDLYVYKHRKKITEYKYKYNIYGNGIRYVNAEIGDAVAMSGDSKRGVFTYSVGIHSGSALKVIDINVDLTFGTEFVLTVPAVYADNRIHNVCMSMDGNTILISGCDTNFKKGYAHVYHYNSVWSPTPNDLSSSQIPSTTTPSYSYEKQYSYGTDSCLSGDGKTVVIFGGPTDALNHSDSGYVWKVDSSIQVWHFVQTINFPYSNRLASCSLSHYGDTLLVTAPVENKWAVFEYNKPSGLFEVNGHVDRQGVSNPGAFGMVAGSMSGNGNTIVYMGHKDMSTTNTEVYVYKRTAGGSWGLDSTIEADAGFVINQPFPHPSVKLLVSFDGGVVLLGNSYSEISSNQLTILNGKTDAPIASVFDYLNEYSKNYRRIDWSVPNWSLASVETTINKDIPHYGTVDSVCISAYGSVIIGSPETNQAFLYDNDFKTLLHMFTESESRFGIRCSIDDSDTIVVVASNTHLHIYDYLSYALIQTIPYDGGVNTESPWNMKMSRDGSTIIASKSVRDTSFTGWTTGNAWVNVSTPVTYNSLDGTKSASAIDLSADGLVMIAAGFPNFDIGYIHLFSKGNGTSKAYRLIDITSPGLNLIIGQSIALSGDGLKAIVGCPNSVGSPSNAAKVYFIDIVSTSGNMSMSPPLLKSFNAVNQKEARYGRSVSIDYNGTYAMVSGSHLEYSLANTTGSALLIDITNAYTLKQDFWKTGLGSKGTPSYRSDWNGYGIHCKLSSQGGIAAVSGGGYVSLFKADPVHQHPGWTQAEIDVIGSGWTQIKYLPGGSTTWFPGNDRLAGYGGTKFLFVTGDFSRWLICEQSAVNGEYYTDKKRSITKSSKYPSAYARRWQNRSTSNTDPWVSIEAYTYSADPPNIMYSEGGNSDPKYLSSIHDSGMYVFKK